MRLESEIGYMISKFKLTAVYNVTPNTRRLSRGALQEMKDGPNSLTPLPLKGGAVYVSSP